MIVSSLPTLADLRLYVGDDFTFQLTVTNPDTSPVSFAVALLVVSAAGMPTFIGNWTNFTLINLEALLAPWRSCEYTSQTDLPATIPTVPTTPSGLFAADARIVYTAITP